MVPELVFLLELSALIIALLDGFGRGHSPRLWIAVAILALALVLPRLASLFAR